MILTPFVQNSILSGDFDRSEIRSLPNGLEIIRLSAGLKGIDPLIRILNTNDINLNARRHYKNIRDGNRN